MNSLSSPTSQLQRIEARLVDELIALLESGSDSVKELEKLQIKLNMVHETQIQAAHLAYEDLKKEELVTAEEILDGMEKRAPRRRKISFEEMPVVWPLGVKERFILRMVDFDHSNGDYVVKFFGEGIVSASGVKLRFEKKEADRVCKTYQKYADELGAKLDLSLGQ